MIRKAVVSDVKALHKMINDVARRRNIIPRSLNELYENVRDMFVHETNGKITGVCAVHVLWEDLAEVRSLVVTKEARGGGIGTLLVRKCLKEAKALGVQRVFALTYMPEYFKRIGFKDIDKAELPHKIWGDCLRCAKFPECDETAVIIDVP